MSAYLEDCGAGRFLVRGRLDFASVPDIWQYSTMIFQQPQRPEQLVIDLAGVDYSDSSGVALLVDWFRQARLQQLDLRYTNVPAQIRAISQISALDECLPFG